MGTSKHRNTSNMKNQNNLSPKIANPILMIPDQNDIGKIPDADFKRMSINIAKRKKTTLKDSNIFEDKNN